jgi:hypothetical protein
MKLAQKIFHLQTQKSHLGRVETEISVNANNPCNMSTSESYWLRFLVIKSENPRWTLNEFQFKQYSYKLTANFTNLHFTRSVTEPAPQYSITSWKIKKKTQSTKYYKK